MTATTMYDDEATIDRVLSELDTLREQLNAIDGALPDYGPSFSTLEQQTASIATAIEKIAASPSVRLSAEQHAHKTTHAVAETIAPTLAKLQQTIDKSYHLQGELISLTKAIRIRSNHWPFPVLAPLMALVVGFLMFPLLARTLPNGAALTAFTTGYLDQWRAGEYLMRSANPTSMAAITRASHLLNDNHDAFKKCQAFANQTNKAQPCTISVAPFAE